MQAFSQITGAAVPFLESNIDTDVIIRIERLTERADLGHYCLEARRYNADGTCNHECVLNDAQFTRAPIMLAGQNFGCGSSREGAVTALMAMGFRVIIAQSFGDIFFANCFRIGMLPIMLSAKTIGALAEQSRKGDFTVDLATQNITMPSGIAVPFSVDALQRQGLLEGLDELGLTLSWNDDILSWQNADRVKRPWVWETQNVSLQPKR